MDAWMRGLTGDPSNGQTALYKYISERNSLGISSQYIQPTFCYFVSSQGSFTVWPTAYCGGGGCHHD